MASNHNSQNNNFAYKWSDDIAQKGFAQVPNCLLTCQVNLGISSIELNVLIQLIQLRFTEKNPYASMEYLALRTGKTPKSVRSAVASLENKGLIQRIYQSGRPSKFNFGPLVHKLEDHTCVNPVRKGSAHRTKSTDQPRTNSTAKEDSKKNIYKRKETFSIGEIMRRRLNEV